MDSSVGMRIISGVISLDVGLGEIDDAIYKMDDVHEREIWKSKLGEVMKKINEELLYPVFRQHPNLGNDV